MVPSFFLAWMHVILLCYLCCNDLCFQWVTQRHPFHSIPLGVFTVDPQISATNIKAISLTSGAKTDIYHWLAHDPSLHLFTTFKDICLFSQYFAFQILEDFFVNTCRTTLLFSFMSFNKIFICSEIITKLITARLLTCYLSYSSALPLLSSLVGLFPNMLSVFKGIDHNFVWCLQKGS